MSEKQAKIKKVSNVKDKKYHGKFKGKHINSNKQHEHVIGPPSMVKDFSSNWKIFLNNQQKNVQPVQMKQKQILKAEQRKLKIIELNPNNANGDNHANVEHKKKLNNVQSQNRKRKRTHQRKPEDKVKSNEIWFDVNPDLLQTGNSRSRSNSNSVTNTATADSSNIFENHTSGSLENMDKKENISLETNLTRYVALDCEMVGVGMDGKESMLARVSIVNSLCECIYDKYVMSKEKVTDYRTHVSGIRPSDLKDAIDYFVVQKEVSDLLKGRVLVGHALQNDLKVLMLSHSKKNIRDTSKYKPFRKLLKTKRPSLKRLAEEILHKEIQVGEHNSVVDAQITMQLYKKYKKGWERTLHMKGVSTTVDAKEIFMGNKNSTKNTKVNKWKKIRDRKKQKENDE